VKKINERPTLATHVLALDLISLADLKRQGYTVRDSATFIRSLTRLQSLAIGKGYPELSRILWPGSAILGSSRLRALRHLSAPVPIDYVTGPRLSLDRFNTLQSLSLTGYDDDIELLVPPDPTILSLVTRLTVSGIYADDRSIASLCPACPALTHLSLYAFDAVYVRLLKLLPSTLLYLELGTIDEDGNRGMGRGAEDCSSELSRFSLLRHLSLDNYLFSSDFLSQLTSLQHLESLHLAGAQIFEVDMSELLAASTCPPSLRLIKLRSDLIKIGSRLEVDDKGTISGVFEPKEEDDWEVAGDWELPEYGMPDHAPSNEELCEIRRVAEESGVKVLGDFVETLAMLDLYHLELANIAIYRCFRYKTLKPYGEHHDPRPGSRLPPLDLDSLDSNKLKLVKTELPDEGWFALSLEAGEV